MSSACVSGVWPEIKAATSRSSGEVVGDEALREGSARDDSVVAFPDIAEKAELDAEDLGEEVRDLVEWGELARERAPDAPALVVRVRPVLDQVPATGDRVVEAREVADREDVWIARAQVFVDHDRAAVEGETRVGEVPCCRLDADADDREVGLDATSTEGRRVAEATVAVQFRQCVAEHDLDAAVPVELRERARQLGMGECREEPLARLDHRHAKTEGPQRGRRLHPDEARADDERPAGRAGGVLDAERVVEGAIAEDAREALAGNPEPPRRRPGCEHEPLVADLLAARERDRAGARVDGRHGRVETDIDLDLVVGLGRRDEDGVRLDAPAQEALGQRWTVVRQARLARQHRHRSPPPASR